MRHVHKGNWSGADIICTHLLVAQRGDDKLCSVAGDSAEWKLGQMPICGGTTPACPGLLATGGAGGDGFRDLSISNGFSSYQASSGMSSGTEKAAPHC